MLIILYHADYALGLLRVLNLSVSFCTYATVVLAQYIHNVCKVERLIDLISIRLGKGKKSGDLAFSRT